MRKGNGTGISDKAANTSLVVACLVQLYVLGLRV